MQYLELHEKAQHGTLEFPFEFHHIEYHHPRYIMNYHWHAEYELIRVLSGKLDMTLDEKELTASAGDLVFVHGGILHSGMPTDCVYECLIFDINVFMKHAPECVPYIQRIIDRSALIYHHMTPESDDYTNIRHIIDNVFSAMHEQQSGYQLITFGEMYHFFGEIFAKHLYLEAVPQSRKGYHKVLQLKSVLDYIDGNYMSQIALDDLAGAASMSAKYFCRFFQQMTHRTPMDYLNYQRIEHACYELSTTEHSVTDVALNCGFNDLSYFIKTFKKYKGVTPGKYAAAE